MLVDWLCRLIQSAAAVKLKFFVDFTFFERDIKIVVSGIRRPVEISILKLIPDLTQNFMYLLLLNLLLALVMQTT